MKQFAKEGQRSPIRFSERSDNARIDEHNLVSLFLKLDSYAEDSGVDWVPRIGDQMGSEDVGPVARC